jgi:hypothetical protein
MTTRSLPYAPLFDALFDLAANLEKGEAEKPLHDYLVAIGHSIERPGISGVLLPLDLASLKEALQEMADAEMPAFTWPEKGPDYLNISFHPGPLRWHDATLGWQEIAAGMQLDDLLRECPGDTFSISLPSKAVANHAWNGISFCVPRSVAVTENPTALHRLSADAGLLFIVGSAAREVTPDEEGAIEFLSSQSRLLLRRVFGDGAPPHPWWKLGFFSKLPMAWTTGGPVFPVEAPGAASWKAELKANLNLQQIEQAAGMIQRRIQHDRQILLPRKEMADQKLLGFRSAPDGARERVNWEQARQRFQAAMTEIEKEASEPARKFMSDVGQPATEKVLSRVGADIIEEEVRKKTKILTIEERFVRQLFQDLKQIFLKHAKTEMKAINAKVTEAFDALMSEATQFGNLSGFDFQLQPESLERDVEPMFSPNINYRGELKVRSFYERFQASRQFVYLILGCSSLLGLSYLSHQPVVIVGIVVVFIFTLFKSARDSREEEEDQKQRELQRITDALRANARQVLTDAQTVKARWYEGRIREFHRAVTMQCENAWKAYGLQQTETLQQQSRDATAKASLLDRQLRSLQEQEQKLAQLLVSLRQFRTQAEQTWRTILEKWPK